MRWYDAIPWVISLLLLILNTIIFCTGRSDKNDTKDDKIHESLLSLSMKMDQVNNTVSEIRTDFKSMDRDVRSLERRMTALETRMDAVEKE